MLYISIAFTLAALMGGMLLLAKTKKESLGHFYSWISYVVIFTCLLTLTCQAARGIIRMAHPKERGECMVGMMYGCDRGGCMMARNCGSWMGRTEHQKRMEECITLCEGKGAKKDCCMEEEHAEESTKE